MTDHQSFVLCGHRGNMAEAAENTLASFASAENVGVSEIELDVRSTADGQLVILHDRTPARTALGPAPLLHTPIEELTLEQVKSIDLGTAEQVPTFAEALDATSVLLQVEIKAPSAARPLARFLRARPAGDWARCLITSFDPLSLSDFRDEWPADEWSGLVRGMALHVTDVHDNWRDHVTRLNVSQVFIQLGQLSSTLVEELHAAGRRVAVSLVENPSEVRRVVELDVDATASNSPGYALRLLRSDEEFLARYPSFAPQLQKTA